MKYKGETKDLVGVKISLQKKWDLRLRSMAKDYEMSLSDIINEMAEWVLDQEKDFREALEEELEDEDEDEDEEEETEKEAE